MIDTSQFISFWDFFSQCFVPLMNLELPLKPLHRHVCEVLQKAVLGDLNKAFICVNIPPRVGKTKLMEALQCWTLAYFPDAQIITVSYSNELATTSVRYVQQAIDSPWYKELFPTRLGKLRQSDQFSTTAGGKVYGDGVGGSLTGLGAGLKRQAGGMIILDDPAKPDEALSRVVGEQLRFWFENTLKSRRNSSRWTPIIICAQRLATDDLPGYIQETYPDDCFTIKFPAMVDGESTIPETVDTRSLLQTEAANPYAFACQYQQEPIVLGGNLIKLANFRYYDPDSPPRFEMKIMTADTALKGKQHNDYAVIQCWGRSLKRAFLIDQIRGKWEPSLLLMNARKFYEKHHKSASPMHYIAIEEAGAGYNLMLEMRKKGIPAKGIIRLTDKVERIKSILAYQETGMVYLPRGMPWLPAFEVELASFRADGKSTLDDQCLIAGTLISCWRGAVPIEEVKVGDKVATREGWFPVVISGKTGESSELYQYQDDDLNRVIGTGNHPVWHEGRFQRMQDIRDGNYCLAVQMEPRTRPVYNLKVDGPPEYFANGVLVHNCDAFADGVGLTLGKATSILNVLGKRKQAA